MALDAGEERWKILYLLGESYRMQGNSDMAERWYKQSIDIYNQYFAPYYRLGIAALQQENYRDAVDNLESAADLKTGVPEIYSNLGIAYYGSADYEKAEQMFRKALDLKPAYVQAWFNLGNLYLYHKESPESICYYERALALNPVFKPAESQLKIAKEKFSEIEELKR